MECEYIKRGREEGSMTIETAIVLPLFILAMICIMNFFVIINYQNILQYSMIHTAKAVGRYSYIISKAENLSANVYEAKLQEAGKDIINSGITLGYIWDSIMSEEVIKYTKKAGVYNSMNGISILTSDVGNIETGLNDIKLNYRIDMDILGEKTYGIRLSNRCYFRVWIGESICKREEEAEDGNHGRTVYITNNGKVYHYNASCSHISLSISSVKLREISSLRNENGAKYKRCTACIKGNPDYDDIVYITASGTRYHSDRNCSKIKRQVVAIDISEVGDKRLCSRCSGE